MKLKMLSAIGVACTLAACAENPDNIRAGYTSAATYQNMSCQQLASEAITVSNRAHDAANVLRCEAERERQPARGEPYDQKRKRDGRQTDQQQSR